MKRIILFFLCLTVTAGLFSGCSSAPAASAAPADASDSVSSTGTSLQIVTTIFPIYDWVRSVAGDQAEHLDITWLLNSGVDLHSYQPTVEDMLTISTCDVFVYVGGESDGWVHDALDGAVNKDMTVINLMDVLGSSVREEEVVEGMEADDHEENLEADEEEGPEYDEHVWLSLKNADTAVGAIAETLAAKDPDHGDVYRANAEQYRSELRDLDTRYQKMTESAARHTLLFGDRFPFRYLTDDYGLDYYAAFVGCSAETEASFETVAFLSGKLDELALPAVLTIEGGDQALARTIIENSRSGDQVILALDSMQGTAARDLEAGKTYLSVMEENLAVLETALN